MSATAEPAWLAALLAESSVADAAVLPAEAGEPAAVLLVPQGFTPGPALRQLVRASAPPGEALPVVLVAGLPWAAGGLDRSAARDLVRTGRYVYRWSPATTSAERVVLAEVARLFPDVEVSMTDSLADLGGDSLTAIQLSERLASRYGREIDPSDVFAAESLRDIAHSVVAGP
jgi:acyl carrier protein